MKIFAIFYFKGLVRVRPRNFVHTKYVLKNLLRTVSVRLQLRKKLVHTEWAFKLFFTPHLASSIPNKLKKN
jgi:hypothetical protein